MFEQAKALWRRLTSRSQPEPNMPKHDDRRVWVRFPTEITTTYGVTQNSTADDRNGVIRDISQGGVKIEVSHPHEEGEMLTVGLPGASGHSPITVLACVVHCAQAGPDRWALGCSFSQQLSDGDLKAFGAARTPTDSDDPSEQRAYQRYKVQIKAQYVVVPSDEDIPARPADVYDISATGIALLTDEDLPAGTLLSTEIQGNGKPFTILVCIVRVIEQDNGQHLLGCSFIHELSESALATLR